MNAHLASPAVPSRLGRLLDALGERCNPVLVRVVRQELRSRTFLSVFFLLLGGGTVAAMVVALAMAVDQRAGGHGGGGSGFFGLMAFGWSFAAVLVQPLMCFRAIAVERNDDTWDLVELTGLRPLAIIGGLMLATLVQGILYAAALAPFLVMAYLLGQLEITVVLFTLAVVPLGGVAAAALAVFAASLADNRASRTVLFVLLALGLLWAWGMSGAMWFNLDDVLRDLIEPLARWDHEAVLGVLLTLNAWIAWTALLLVFAGALLAHRAENRSTGPRLAWWALWANGLAWAFAGPAFLYDTAHPWWLLVLAALFVFSCIAGGHAAILGIFAASEEWELSPRQARGITGARGWRRLVTPFLGPGAARGRLCWLAMAAASLAVAGGVTLAVDGLAHLAGTPHGSGLEEHVARLQSIIADRAFLIVWMTTAWSAIGITLADTLARTLCRSWFPTPVLRRGFTLLVMSLLVVIPSLVVWLLGLEHGLEYLAPIQGFATALDTNGIQEYPAFVVFSLAAGGVLGWQLVLGLRLRIDLARVEARDEDRNPRGG